MKSRVIISGGINTGSIVTIRLYLHFIGLILILFRIQEKPMSKLAIVIDSTAYLPQNYIEQYQFRVAPQILIMGEQTYQDGVDILPAEFYRRLESAKTLPTTSQVSPATFHSIFSQELEQGNDVLALLISSKLSGTMQSALQAQEMLPGARLEVVDTCTTAMGLGFIALAVARAAEEGASLAECKSLAERAIATTGIFFMVDTLKYLHMGGRIGGGARFLATTLDLKPILEVRDGRIEAAERVRTKSKALQRLLELTENRIGNRKPVRIATLHAKAESEAITLLDQAKDRFQAIESVLSEVSPTVGTHAGPGTVGIAFMAGL